MDHVHAGRIPQGVPAHTLPALVVVSRSELSLFSVAPSAATFGHAGDCERDARDPPFV